MKTLEERLRVWGIVEVFDDYRGARLDQIVRVEAGPVDARVTIEKSRASFTVTCLDCGPSPHVSPDDHSIAVCLRCGRDMWL